MIARALTTIRVLSIAAIAALVCVQAAHAVEPAANCAAAKQKAAAKKLSDKVKCHGKAIKKGIAVDPACLTKAETKFETSFAKAEGKGGCVTEGDVDAIEQLIDDTLAQLLGALPPTTTTTTQPACIDNDQDGYGTNCPAGDDCDDGDASVYPGADEVCDGKDNNCNNQVDENAICPAGAQCVNGQCLVPLCPVDGGSTACDNYYAGGACPACCNNQGCAGECELAVFPGGGVCSSATENDSCATAINLAGCADVCCP